MNLLLIIVAVVAVVLFIVGGLGEALQFLWIIAGILLVIAIIVFLARIISGRKGV